MKIKSHLWTGQQRKYAHYKLDGNCTHVERLQSSALVVTTSNGKDVTNKCKGYAWFQRLNFHMPLGAQILGELCVPGKKASYVKRAIARGEETTFAGFALPGCDPNMGLKEVNHILLSWDCNVIPFAVNEISSTLARPEYLKWKPVKSIELIICGFSEGDGKNLGLIGAPICRTFEGHIIANAAAMPQSVRLDMSLDEDAYIGKVIEVHYQYVGAKGKLRHPRYKMIRDDKKPEECTIDQDTELKEFYS
jgi:hypothetical protein